MNKLTSAHFSTHSQFGTLYQNALLASEAAEVITPNLYKEALTHFLNSWERSYEENVSVSERPDPEHEAHISGLKEAIADPELLGVGQLIYISRLPENAEGYTHFVGYGLYGATFPFREVATEKSEKSSA